MRYREVLSQAYTLTVRNPFLWLFGLVMLGGFNLSLINFFSIFRDHQWKQWPLQFDYLFGSPFVGWGVLVCSIILVFVLLNIFKMIFISLVHNLIHEKNNQEENKQPESAKCNLCLISGDLLPYRTWLPRIIFSSLITVGFTVGVSFAANSFVRAGGYDGLTAAVVINFFFVALMAVVLGVWNAFTNYFIIFYDLNFERASGAAINLIVSKYRQIFEFIILLSLIHSVSVLITNSFINVSRYPDMQFRLVLECLVVLWFALNNTFFNIAFIGFFDRIVKSIPKEKQSSRLLPENRLN